MKAIKIDTSNRAMLATRFALEDPEDQLPLGYWLVTEFGVDEHFSLLSQEKFTERFVAVESLQNGFVAIEEVS